VLDKILSNLFGSLSKKQIKLNNSKLVRQKKVCYMKYVYLKRERERERREEKRTRVEITRTAIICWLLWSFIIL